MSSQRLSLYAMMNKTNGGVSQPRAYHVGEQLTRSVVNGDFAVGTTLPNEQQLAQTFGVSRTVIREAVRDLVKKGLIDVRHGSGMWVLPEDKWNHLDPIVLLTQVSRGEEEDVLLEVLEARRLIEVNAAGQAAGKRTQEQLETLQTIVASMEKELAQPDNFARLDVAFHEQIMLMSGNRILRETFRQIAEVLAVGRYFSQQQPGGIAKSMEGHRSICAAVVKKNRKAAETAMLKHVQQFEHDILKALRSQALAYKRMSASRASLIHLRQ
jgi:DNA-binding FadR family transcriptional regulator